MKPVHISTFLRKIATKIENSKNPRIDLVNKDIKLVIASLGLNDDQELSEAIDFFSRCCL